MIWLLAILPALAGIALLAPSAGAASTASLASLLPTAWRRQLAAETTRRIALAGAAGITLVLTLLAVLLALIDGWHGTLVWSRLLHLQAGLTPLSAAVALLVPAVALPVLVFAASHEPLDGLRRLIGWLLLFVGAMELLVIAGDLLTLLIGWELVGACSWALIGHHWRDPQAPRSAGFAFLMTRLGDLGLYVAAMTAFSAVGSMAYADLDKLPRPALDLLAGGLIVAAASKSAQLPFSPWLFRAMTGPTSASALLHSATMVAAGAFVLARLQPQLAVLPWFSGVVMTIGIATALGAGVVALLQPHAKKLLAASTSAHVGLMFAAIAGGYPGVAIAHLLAHACFKAQLFCCAGMAGDRAGSHALASMRLGRSLPLVGVVSAIGALALAGVPPLGAAWTKEALVAAAGSLAPWAALLVIVGGALSAASAVRFQLLAFGRAGNAGASARPLSAGVAGALLALALATTALSLLWLPALRDAVERSWAIRLIEVATWQSAATLVAVGFGLLGGRWLAMHHAALGEQGLAARLADWGGLPSLIDRLITEPVLALVRLVDRIDRLIDLLPRSIGRAIGTLARHSAGIDQRVIDRGVRRAATLAQALAGVGNRFGELFADGLPRVGAALVAQGGRDIRRAHSGLSHHQFAFLAIGAVLLTALLIVAH